MTPANVVLTIGLWVAVLWLVRRQRARLGPNPPARAARGYRLHTVAAITATVGVTWFSAWLISDSIGPGWVHSLSLPAAIVFIAVAVTVAAYAGWVGGP